MHKRFTDIHKWKDRWFRKLPPEYKCLWSFICDECDNAGVWKVDMETASHFIGASVEESKALEHFGSRINVLRSDCWLVDRFVEFQFGELSKASPLHQSVLALAERHTLRLPYPYPKTRVLVKEEVKDKVKEKEEVKDVSLDLPKNAFEEIWARYPRKLGKHQSERFFKKQVRSMNDWLDINNALDRFRAKLNKEATEEQYIPHGSTWFNNRWRDWIKYEEASNASDGGKGIYQSAIERTRAREAEEIRKREFSQKQIPSRI